MSKIYLREYIEDITMYNLILKINICYKNWKLIQILQNNIDDTYIAILEKEK